MSTGSWAKGLTGVCAKTPGTSMRKYWHQIAQVCMRRKTLHIKTLQTASTEYSAKSKEIIFFAFRCSEKHSDLHCTEDTRTQTVSHLPLALLVLLARYAVNFPRQKTGFSFKVIMWHFWWKIWPRAWLFCVLKFYSISCPSKTFLCHMGLVQQT